MSGASVRKAMTGRGIPLPGDDIDTDRIIPARYLKCVTFDELGRYAFQDERFDSEGRERPHPMNDPAFAGHEILIVNRNFGCGSSREHAPQSLMRAGVRAIVGESFAEIFAGNCTALGIPAVRVTHDAAVRLQEVVGEAPETVITIDLERAVIRLGGGEEFPLTMPDAARKSLVTGEWDTTGVLLAAGDEIERTAARLPYVSGYRAAV
jgi:3-isopropylmalate/(R)-2-methylmalate dehydratase small subunit